MKQALESGWPTKDKGKAAEYWQYRNEISRTDGLLLYRNQIIIPQSMRREMLEKIHVGHLGMDKCKQRARQSVFWPSMNRDIEEFVRKCKECSRHQPSKPTEPLQSHELPSYPWQRVGSDLFSWGHKDYLILVDYLTLWPEVYKLDRANSANVITSFKDSFSRNGVPHTVVSDNGTQYSAKRFKAFGRSWGFEHITSSPYHARSNGLAEITVKSVKNIIKKCHESNEDIFEGLLVLRNSPLKCGYSPAEMMFQRQLCDNLPRAQSGKETSVKRDLAQERLQAKQYHDRKQVVLDRSLFREGELVAVQDTLTGEWLKRAEIIKLVAPRSYEVKMLGSGNVLRRNQRHLRKLHCLGGLKLSKIDSNVVGSGGQIMTGDREKLDSDSEESDGWITTSSDWVTDSDEEVQQVSSFGRIIKPRQMPDYDDL